MYSYECIKCHLCTEEIRIYEDREKEGECGCCGKKTRFIFDRTPAIHIDELSGVEYRQYWKKDPKAPGGMRIFPHKNKYGPN